MSQQDRGRKVVLKIVQPLIVQLEFLHGADL